MEMTTNKLRITVSRVMQYSSVLMKIFVRVTGIGLQEVLRGGIQMSAASSDSIIRDSDCGSEVRAAEVQETSDSHRTRYLFSFPSSFMLRPPPHPHPPPPSSPFFYPPLPIPSTPIIISSIISFSPNSFFPPYSHPLSSYYYPPCIDSHLVFPPYNSL